MSQDVATGSVDTDDLVLSHIGLARSVARKFRNRGEPAEDLDQVALLALVKAARNFDPGRNVAFATFALLSVTGEMKRHFRDKAWWVRAPRRLHDLYLRIGEAREALSHQLRRSPTVSEMARYLNVTDEELLEAMEAGDGFTARSLDAPARGRRQQPRQATLADHLASADAPSDSCVDRVAVAAAMETLDADQRFILKSYFYDELTQREIGDRLGCSQMQVSRLLARSLRRVQARLGVEPTPSSEGAGGVQHHAGEIAALA